MYSQARSRVQFLMTYMAFKMFCFLVLYKDLLFIKISITVPGSTLLRYKNNNDTAYLKNLSYDKRSDIKTWEQLKSKRHFTISLLLIFIIQLGTNLPCNFQHIYWKPTFSSPTLNTFQCSFEKFLLNRFM